MKKSEFVSINTESMKKPELLDMLKKSATIKGLDENLKSRIDYAVKVGDKFINKVSKPDMIGLIDEVKAFLSAPKAAPAEALKAPKKSKKQPVEESTAEPEEKTEKKSKGLKKVKTAPQKVSKNGLPPVASMFPETLAIDTSDGEVVLKREHEKYHTIEEIREAIENGKTLFITSYWTKLHIKRFDYAQTFNVEAPKSFPDDLDVLNVVCACDSIPRLWCMSNYTEAMSCFEGEDFQPIEDVDPATDEKFTVRVSNGCEFEIYELDE